MMNVMRMDQLLPKGTAIGQLVPIEQLDPDGGNERDVTERIVQEKDPAVFEARISPTLPSSEKEQLVELLLEFQDCFADKGESLGCCKLTEHAIPIGNAAPIKKLPRRRAWRERDLIRDEVNEML